MECWSRLQAEPPVDTPAWDAEHPSQVRHEAGG